MLCRNAQGLYWLGRYLQRGEHLCRQLQLQVETLVDRPVHEINFGWSRIYRCIGRSPPVGGFEFGTSDDYTLADSYTLADDLTFDRGNIDSIWKCIELGRENASQVRQCLSLEMWTCLNLTYLRLREMDINDIWAVSPESFYAETVRDINAFAGVAEATMHRDEGWHFLRLGRYIEHAQSVEALLLAQMESERDHEEPVEEDWTSLLRGCQALEAYVVTNGIEIVPERVIDFIVTDGGLPGSLERSVGAIIAELSAIEQQTGTGASEDARKSAEDLRHLIRETWQGGEDREALLLRATGLSRRLHEQVMTAYIDYDYRKVSSRR